jgi:ubiquinone/menaquinone biosynthesis C-methylase UbiE
MTMTEQNEIITTFSEMAPRYESLMNNELNKFWGISYKNFVSNLLNDISSDKDDLILDIATGTGFIPSFLIKKNLKFKKMIGLDLTFGMLKNAKKSLVENDHEGKVSLVCASAHQMPFMPGSFDQAICCLATHHMNVETLLSNVEWSLKSDGNLYIADAGGSSRWANKIIKLIIKAAAFLYFIIAENYSRAVAESAAIGNIHTAQEWEELVKIHGFVDIKIQQMKSKRFWAPDPIMIKAKKNSKERQ